MASPSHFPYPADMNEQTTTSAGRFITWLEQTNAAETADVPCGDCNACCRASYFIHVNPSDQQALGVIPQALLFPAPGQDRNQQVMGFNEAGACPMLVNAHCAIYQHRPGTCRDYDCRIFAATGIRAGDQEKQDVNAQVNRWQFEYPTAADHAAQAAVMAAVRFLHDHEQHFSDPPLPTNPSERALLALGQYELFLNINQAPDSQKVIAEIKQVLALNRPK